MKMKKKKYIAPEVGQYLIEGPLMALTVSPRKNAPVKVNGKDLTLGDGDEDGQEANSRKFEGWSWDD